MNRSTYTIAVFFSLFTSLTAFAQNQASHFPFVDFELNFSSGGVNVTSIYAHHENGGAGSISDANGNLLMYTDGFSIWNRNHQLMPNGADLVSNLTTRTVALIVPKPGSNSLFYVFLSDQVSAFFYAIVDLSLNGGLGDVTSKGTKLLQKPTDYVSAAFHENGSDVWVAAHETGSNTYFTLLVSNQGISNMLEQAFGSSFYANQIKFSPAGNKLASITDDGISVADFNGSTGAISNSMNFTFNDLDSSPFMAGLDFSSDGTKLYASEVRYSAIFQFDLSSNDYNQIKKSRHALKTPVYNNNLWNFQLAPDGKIYITKGGGGGGDQHVGVIDNPNALGNNVIFKENSLYLDGHSSFVAYTPNFIQSYFYKTSFSFDGHCQQSPVSFKVTNLFHVDSVRWNFGEGSTTNALNPSFTYKNSGDYTVELLAYYQGITSTISQTVHVDAYTKFSLRGDTTLCKDTRFEVPDTHSLYQWNTGDTTRYIRVQQGGLFWLNAINNAGCAYRDTVVIAVKELPTIDLPDSVLLGSASSVLLTPGSFSTYAWSTGATTPTISVSTDGWYSVAVTNSDGCLSVKSLFVSKNPPIEEPELGWILLNPKPSNRAATDMYFLDERRGFLVNGKQLLQTIDGGVTWKIQMKMPLARRIAFKNGIGYAVGDNGVVYKSTHNGEGWNTLALPFVGSLNAISVIHPDTVVISGDNKVFSTNNGGQTWTTRQVTGGDVQDSFFTSSKVGHAVCLDGRILKTKDGGLTWQTKVTSNSVPSDFYRVKFVNEKVGYASRAHSEIFKTNDGGETWTIAGNAPDAAYDLQFLTEKAGFIAGPDGAMSKTLDGGMTWQWAGFAGRIYGNDLFTLFFVDENLGFAAGSGGRILKTVNGGKTWDEYALTYKGIQNLSFVSQQTGYFQAGGNFYKSTNRGIDWKYLGQPLPDQKTGDFHFVNENIGYAIVGGTPGTSASSTLVYKTSDGGVTWNNALQGFLTWNDLYGLYFINEDVGFVSTGFGPSVAFRSSDGGATWTTVSTTGFGQIQFLNDNVGYARNIANYYNRIYKTTDGGLTWNIVYEVDQDITSFHFINESTGFIVGDSGFMYKTSNGGSTWQKINPPYAYYVNVRFISEKFGYIVDDYSHLYVTKDGGSSWNNVLLDYGVSGMTTVGGDVYAYGAYGTILRKNSELSDFVTLDFPSSMDVTDSTAVVVSFIRSTFPLSSAPSYVESRKDNGSYGPGFQIKLLNGYANEGLSYKLTHLDADTRYYFRFGVVNGTNQVVTSEAYFNTLPKMVTGVEDRARSSLKLYPNPAGEVLVIENDGEFSYELHDLLGRRRLVGSSSQKASVNLSGFDNGIYFVRVTDRLGTVTAKVAVTR